MFWKFSQNETIPHYIYWSQQFIDPLILYQCFYQRSGWISHKSRNVKEHYKQQTCFCLVLFFLFDCFIFHQWTSDSILYSHSCVLMHLGWCSFKLQMRRFLTVLRFYKCKRKKNVCFGNSSFMRTNQHIYIIVMTSELYIIWRYIFLTGIIHPNH